jgi:hypothetical protein
MGMKFKAVEAVREKIAVKIALMGASGSGKSYTSLRLATGMLDEMEKIDGKRGKILLANTEGSRGRYYANEFKYDIVDLESPYNPELFIDLINYAVDEKYSVLIIDSSSAEWEGKGGCLELQQQLGGKYQDWSKVSPRHDRFIDALALSPIHIIATMKGKDQYEVDKDDRGKVSVKKLGVGAKQREGFEYNFTCTFNIDRDSHVAKSEKDNTHIFEKEGDVLLSEAFGEKIIKWANSGEGVSISDIKFAENREATGDGTVTEANELANKLSEIKSLTGALTSANVDREIIATAIKKFHIVNGKPSANFNSIKSVDVANNVINELLTLKG